MDADTLLQMTIARLRRHEGRYIEIAQQNPGFSYSWLTKLAHGQITNPTVSNLQQLIEALDAFEASQQRSAPPPAPKDPDEGRIVAAEEGA